MLTNFIDLAKVPHTGRTRYALTENDVTRTHCVAYESKSSIFSKFRSHYMAIFTKIGIISTLNAEN